MAESQGHFYSTSVSPGSSDRYVRVTPGICFYENFN